MFLLLFWMRILQSVLNDVWLNWSQILCLSTIFEKNEFRFFVNFWRGWNFKFWKFWRCRRRKVNTSEEMSNRWKCQIQPFFCHSFSFLAGRVHFKIQSYQTLFLFVFRSWQLSLRVCNIWPKKTFYEMAKLNCKKVCKFDSMREEKSVL